MLDNKHPTIENKHVTQLLYEFTLCLSTYCNIPSHPLTQLSNPVTQVILLRLRFIVFWFIDSNPPAFCSPCLCRFMFLLSFCPRLFCKRNNPSSVKSLKALAVPLLNYCLLSVCGDVYVCRRFLCLLKIL